MKKQVLRKEIQRIVIGNVETIKNEYIERDVLSKEELDDLQDHWEDPEEAFDVGLIFDFNEEFICIEIDKLLKGLDAYFEGFLDSDDTHTLQWGLFVKIKEKLQIWKGHDLWVENG